LFRTSIRKSRLRVNDVCKIVGAVARRASLPTYVTPRTLRHTFATHLMDRGVDLAVIASLMGHRSPQETGVYLHVLPGRPQAAVRKLSIGGRS
jgi:integrase/recombinase XerD